MTTQRLDVREDVPLGWRVVDFQPAWNAYIIAPRWWAPPIRVWFAVRNHWLWLIGVRYFLAQWWSVRPKRHELI